MKLLVLAAALYVAPSLQHSAILPPIPDKQLYANTSEASAGCKLLASDKGWPAESVWKAAFPGIFKKLAGTSAPDWMVQARTVEDVQKVVNFARDHNVRLSIITTGHDFHQRGTARSGLRLDLAALREPTVFSKEWKCGDTLKPTTKSGRVVDSVQACQVLNLKKRSLSVATPQRNHDFRFFEKRDGFNCDSTLALHKRQHEGMDMGHAPEEVPQYNVIKTDGKSAYARVSAGMYNELFYTQADKSGLMTVGAQHGGVGVVGGWMQAGGHNPFSNKFGMQVDQVMEIEVVTADGKFQKVSACSNPELYWALRGGGGGTFGVVTGATIKVHPTFPVTVTRFFVNSTSKMGIMKATSYFLQEGSKLRDQYGLMGYFYVYPGSFSSAMHMPDKFATVENAKAVTEPLMKKMEEIAGSKVHIQPEYIQHKSYKDWYTDEYGNEETEEKGILFRSWNDGSDGPVPSEAQAMDNPMMMIPWAVEYPSAPVITNIKRSVSSAWASVSKRALEHAGTLMKRNTYAAQMGSSVMRSQASSKHYLDSLLLSDKHVKSVSIDKLAEAINGSMPAIPGIHIRGFLLGGGEQAKPAKDAMGLLPAWRDMTYHFITNAVPGSIRHDYGIEPLAKLFPDAGGYVNEASTNTPDWKRAYWGDHYAKLESLKQKYDPKNVFWCTPCVGADMFTYDDERICPNANYKPVSTAALTPGAPASALSAPPMTYADEKSKTGIASIKGGPGIPEPLTEIVTTYLTNKTLPTKMLKSSYFKIAMGEGGSALGKYADMDPFHPGQKLTDWPLKW